VDALGNGHLEVYEAEGGLVRAHYRTTMTAEDEFSRSFLGEIQADGSFSIPGERLARWCLDRFVQHIEFRRSPSDPWERRPFSWSLLREMTGELASGWPVMLSAEIAQKVLRTSEQRVSALKKTSLTGSATSTLVELPFPVQPSPTST
jgi:hypothetical protein